MSRYQARRRDGRRQVAIVAVLLGAVVVLAFATTYLLLGPAAPVATGTPTAGSTHAAVETPTPAPTPGATEPEKTSSPTASPAAPTPSPTSTPRPTTTPTATPRPTQKPTQKPTEKPAPSPTVRPPSPSPTPSPSSPPGPRSIYVTSGPSSGSRVALTFDFGGRIGDAKAIVDYLIANDVQATVFITGKQIDTTPEGRWVLERICPRTDQFALGNHSYSHPSFDGLTPAQMRSELSKTEAAFAKYCDRSPRPFFRPPNGALGGYRTAKYYQILDTVGAAGYARTVAWSIDTLDWGAPGTVYYRTTAQIVDNVESHAAGGSIVLMHLGGYNTLAAVEQLVPWLRNHGFVLVNLHELLGV